MQAAASADLYADPPTRGHPAPLAQRGITVMDGLDTRVGLMQANDSIDSAYDPYTFVRDAYIQNRRYKIYDGNPPNGLPDYDLRHG